MRSESHHKASGYSLPPPRAGCQPAAPARVLYGRRGRAGVAGRVNPDAPPTVLAPGDRLACGGDRVEYEGLCKTRHGTVAIFTRPHACWSALPGESVRLGPGRLRVRAVCPGRDLCGVAFEGTGDVEVVGAEDECDTPLEVVTG